MKQSENTTIAQAKPANTSRPAEARHAGVPQEYGPRVGERRMVQALATAVCVIVVLIPFQAVLTTWLGSNFGHLDAFRIWKDILLFVLCLITLTVACLRPTVRHWLFTNRLHQLMFAFCAYVLYMTAYGLLRRYTSPSAAIYGLLVDGRIFATYLLVATLIKLGATIRNWPRYILVPAVLVVGFGLLQMTILPVGILRHAGYGPSTIPAIHTIDNKPEFVRIQSTLRGPNPFGAYLVVIAAMAIAWAWVWHARLGQVRGSFVRWLLGACAALVFLVVLYGTYSRSAWLGTLCVLIGLVIWRIRLASKIRLVGSARLAGLFVAIVLGVAIVAIFTYRNNDAVQNALFHTSRTSRSSVSSNAERTRALRSGIHDVAQEPFGRGVGTAGPASVRNAHGATRLAENYFVQLAQETGIIGLALFVAAYALVGYRLWCGHHPYAAAITASLVGLTLVNMVSHAWVDDTLAYLWWFVAAMVMAQPSKHAILRSNKPKITA